MLSLLSLGVIKMAKQKKQNVDSEVEIKIENPEEEQKKLDKSLDLIPLCREKSDTPYHEEVENERKNIFKVYKKARTENNIIMVITVLVFIASMILMVTPETKSWGTIAGGVAIGVVIVFLIVHYILTRNLFPNTTKNYIRYFMEHTDNYIFDIENVHDQKLYFEKRYVVSDVLQDRCYKDVIDTASRNIVSGTYKEKPFECGELALYKAGAKRYQKAVIFVGKYLTAANNLHFPERYIIQIKAVNETDKPNDIEDLVILHEQNNFVVYGKEGANFEKDLGKELLDNLKSIECTGALLNVNIVLWAGRTAAYLSYDDSIVAIPFDKAIVPESYAQLKKNISEVLEILVD